MDIVKLRLELTQMQQVIEHAFMSHNEEIQGLVKENLKKYLSDKSLKALIDKTITETMDKAIREAIDCEVSRHFLYGEGRDKINKVIYKILNKKVK